ncbi:hypothetical protein B0H19DRAFT_1067182 [Mycena capillaripes]|nr:hypothetical protein B0H19DRAFT_1067182 [Mycena capillaripes]
MDAHGRRGMLDKSIRGGARRTGSATRLAGTGAGLGTTGAGLDEEAVALGLGLGRGTMATSSVNKSAALVEGREAGTFAGRGIFITKAEIDSSMSMGDAARRRRLGDESTVTGKGSSFYNLDVQLPIQETTEGSALSSTNESPQRKGLTVQLHIQRADKRTADSTSAVYLNDVVFTYNSSFAVWQTQFEEENSSLGYYVPPTPHGIVSSAPVYEYSAIWQQTQFYSDKSGPSTKLVPRMNSSVSSIYLLQCSQALVTQQAVVDVQSQDMVMVFPGIEKTVSSRAPFSGPDDGPVDDDGVPLFMSSRDGNLFLDAWAYWYNSFSVVVVESNFLRGLTGFYRNVDFHSGLYFLDLGSPTPSRTRISQFKQYSDLISPGPFLINGTVAIATRFPQGRLSSSIIAVILYLSVRLWLIVDQISTGLAASFVLMLLSLRYSFRPTSVGNADEKDTLINGPGVLQTIWLYRNHPKLRQLLKQVEHPTNDNLRKAGAVEIRLVGEGIGKHTLSENESLGHAEVEDKSTSETSAEVTQVVTKLIIDSAFNPRHHPLCFWGHLGKGAGTPIHLCPQQSGNGFFSCYCNSNYICGCIMTLHITTPALVSLETFNTTSSIRVGTQGLPTYSNLSLHDGDKIDAYAPGSLSFFPTIVQNTNQLGLSGGTLYEVLDLNLGEGNATVNATGFNISCGYLTDVVQKHYSSSPLKWKMQVGKGNTSFTFKIKKHSFIQSLSPQPLTKSIMLASTIPIVDSENKLGPATPLKPSMHNNSWVHMLQYSLSLVNQKAIVDAQSHKIITVDPDIGMTVSSWLPFTGPEDGPTDNDGIPLFVNSSSQNLLLDLNPGSIFGSKIGSVVNKCYWPSVPM